MWSTAAFRAFAAWTCCGVSSACAPFWPCRIAAFCMCSVASSMIVWVGDNNLLLTLPFYFVLLFFCTQGDSQARLVGARLPFLHRHVPLMR